MSRREKLLQKIRQALNDVTFSDLRKLLESEDFFLDRITGSHYVFRRGDTVFARADASKSSEDRLTRITQ